MAGFAKATLSTCILVSLLASPGSAETVTLLRLVGSGEVSTNPTPFRDSHLGEDAPFTFDLTIDLAPDIPISSSPLSANYERRVTGTLNFSDQTILDLSEGVISVGNSTDVDQLVFLWVPGSISVPGSAFGGEVTMKTSFDTLQPPNVTFQWRNRDGFYDGTSVSNFNEVIDASQTGAGDAGLISVNFASNLNVQGLIFRDSISVTAVPEPSSFAVIAALLAITVGVSRSAVRSASAIWAVSVLTR